LGSLHVTDQQEPKQEPKPDQQEPKQEPKPDQQEPKQEPKTDQQESKQDSKSDHQDITKIDQQETKIDQQEQKTDQQETKLERFSRFLGDMVAFSETELKTAGYVRGFTKWLFDLLRNILMVGFLFYMA